MSIEERASVTAGKNPLEVIIVSTSPSTGLALQHLLEDRLDGLTTHRAGIDELLAAPGDYRPGLLMLAPQAWGDLSHWLPQLLPRFSPGPWLLFSDLDVCGLYLSRLAGINCALVPSTATPTLLRSAIQALTSGRATTPTAAFLQLFSELLQPTQCGRPGESLALVEIQCACAISLGLTDQEVAHLLGERIGLLRRRVHRLAQKMGVADRSEIAVIVREHLGPVQVAVACQRLFDPSTGDLGSEA